MKKYLVVLATMFVAIFVASSIFAGEHAKDGACIKGKVKVDGEKVMLVKADGASVEITGAKVEDAKKLDGKEVMVAGEEKDGKVEAQKVVSKDACEKKGKKVGCGGCDKGKKDGDK